MCKNQVTVRHWRLPQPMLCIGRSTAFFAILRNDPSGKVAKHSMTKHICIRQASSALNCFHVGIGSSRGRHLLKPELDDCRE